jgi:fibronectin type 3 domain-containing protein
VELTWDAPASSSDPVAGYNIYRAVSGGSFQLLNTSVNAPTAYTDSTVGGGIAYTYQVTSVDAEGNQSAPSNTYNVTIP